MSSTFPIRRIKEISFPPPPVFSEPDARVDPSWRRLNLNESRLAPSPKALHAMRDAINDINNYPDHGCAALAELISQRMGVDPGLLSFGNGSGELLVAAAMISVQPGDEAIFPSPTFPTCPKGVQIAGGTIVDVPVTDDGTLDIDAMLGAITPKTRMFYLCTPNNPTGGVVSAEDLRRVAEEVPDDCLLVVDEAYYEFAVHEGSADVLAQLRTRTGAWVVTRTFSKAYALSGMRVGYVIASDADIKHGLWQLRPNFNVNRLAQAAARAAMLDEDHLAFILDSTIRERRRLADAVAELGWRAFPSGANFLTVSADRAAGEIVDKLQKFRILVQEVPWPAGHGSIRITIGNEQETGALIDALREIAGAAA